MIDNPQPLLDAVISCVTRHSLLQKDDAVLVGLSAGADSVCLLTLLRMLREEYRLSLSAVYVNHNLRPEETPAEIALCTNLCRVSGVPFSLREIDLQSGSEGRNLQEAARELRYRAFHAAAAEAGATKIGLGHTADDQAETVLMRLIRGSGPGGLAGIPIRRGMIIRPLLQTSRLEIERFLQDEGIPFLTDSSNRSDHYLRNRLRQNVMPEILRINPSFLSTVMHTVSVFRDEERYLSIAVTKALMKMISRKTDSRIELFLIPMETLDVAILRRVLRRALDEVESLRAVTFRHIDEVIRLVREGAAGDRLHLPRGIRVIRDYSLLIITSDAPARIAEYELPVPGEIALQGAGLVVTAVRADGPDGNADGRSTVVLDAELLRYPLKVRPRRQGDFFYPLGFGKRKKLQDYFVDEKVPRDERDSVPIVFSGDDIVWVAGYRADERFRAREGTKKFLKLAIVKGKF